MIDENGREFEEREGYCIRCERNKVKFLESYDNNEIFICMNCGLRTKFTQRNEVKGEEKPKWAYH